MIHIYVLQLEDYRFFVGKTKNPQFKLEEHFRLSNYPWTQKFTPIKVIEIIPNCNDNDLDNYTLKYMQRYGIYCVRGGSYQKLYYDKNDECTIQNTIDNSTFIWFKVHKKVYPSKIMRNNSK
jgi:hypothetical protein